VRKHRCKEGRLGVAASRRPFGRRTAVVLQFEQSKLPCLFGSPCLKLLAAQFAKLLPAIAVAIDNL